MPFAAIVGFCLPTVIIIALAYVYSLLFPLPPEKCESRRCGLSCFDSRANYVSIRIGIENERGILYIRCGCGHEYLKFGDSFFAKIREDGTLEPYIKNTRCWGWRKDNGKNFDGANFKIDSEMLKRLRNGTQKNSPSDEEFAKRSAKPRQSRMVILLHWVMVFGVSLIISIVAIVLLVVIIGE